MHSDQTDEQDSSNGGESAYKKICNRLILIFERCFDLTSQPRMLIDFGSKCDFWYDLPKKYDKDKFTLDNIISAIENEVKINFTRMFRINMGKVEDLWIPVTDELLNNILNENEYENIGSLLMMIRCDFLSGKINNVPESADLFLISVMFSPGEIR